MSIRRKRFRVILVIGCLLLIALVCLPWTLIRPYRAYACRSVGEDVGSGRLAPDAQGYVHVSYPWVAIDDRAVVMRQADGSAVVLFVQQRLYRQDWIGMVYHEKPLSPPFITVWPGIDPTFNGPRGEPVRVRPYGPNVSFASYLESQMAGRMVVCARATSHSHDLAKGGKIVARLNVMPPADAQQDEQSRE